MQNHEYFSAEIGPFFESIIKFNKCKIVVEIGVAYGTTTKYLCSGASNNNGIVHCYDKWSTHGKDNIIPQFSNKVDVSNYLISKGCRNFELNEVDTFSPEFDSMLGSIGKIDFAFIDGDHSYSGIKNDFDKIFPLLSTNGIIAFHDTYKIDGCREFIIDLRTKYNDGTFDILDFPFGNEWKRCGTAVLQKRSKHLLEYKVEDIYGSLSSPDDIYKKEKDWYDSQIKR